MGKAIVILGLAVLVAMCSSEECPSLLSVVRREPSCIVLEDCTGLQCYSEKRQQNVTFVVDKCTDPIVVNITIANATGGGVILSQSFTESTNTGDILVTMDRNNTYVHVKVTSSDRKIQLIPYTEVPINSSFCQCEDLKYIKDNMAVLGDSCETNSECSGIDCNLYDGSDPITVETEIDPCSLPPGFFFIIRNKTNNTVIYEHFFDHTQNDTIFDSGDGQTFMFDVIIEHRNYSMILEAWFDLGGVLYPAIPKKQVILDKSECAEPTVNPHNPGTPPPPVSKETCDAIQGFANASVQTCITNSRCDGVTCQFLDYNTTFQVLPCHHPPGVHIIIFDPSRERVYDEIVSNRTVVPLEDIPGTSVVIDVKDTDGAIGLQVSLKTDFGTAPLIPLTEIPYDRCLCSDVVCSTSTSMPGPTTTKAIPRSTTTVGPSSSAKPAKSGSDVVSIIVPAVLGAVIVVILIVVIVLCVIIFVMKKKRNSGFTFEPIPFNVDDDDVSVNT